MRGRSKAEADLKKNILEWTEDLFMIFLGKKVSILK